MKIGIDNEKPLFEFDRSYYINKFKLIHLIVDQFFIKKIKNI